MTLTRKYVNHMYSSENSLDKNLKHQNFIFVLIASFLALVIDKAMNNWKIINILLIFAKYNFKLQFYSETLKCIIKITQL